MEFDHFSKNQIKRSNFSDPPPLKNYFHQPSKNFKKIDSKISKNTSPINENEILNLKIGDQVVHQRFGKGKILELIGNYPNTKATVFFPSAGQKQLLLKFAKLQLI